MISGAAPRRAPRRRPRGRPGRRRCVQRGRRAGARPPRGSGSGAGSGVTSLHRGRRRGGRGSECAARPGRRGRRVGDLVDLVDEPQLGLGDACGVRVGDHDAHAVAAGDGDVGVATVVLHRLPDALQERERLPKSRSARSRISVSPLRRHAGRVASSSRTSSSLRIAMPGRYLRPRRKRTDIDRAATADRLAAWSRNRSVSSRSPWAPCSGSRRSPRRRHPTSARPHASSPTPPTGSAWP